MADTTERPSLGGVGRHHVIDALRSAYMRLRPKCHRSISTASPCADLWDEHLELIELLQEIEAELGVTDRLDWKKAPKRSADINDFVEWIQRELNNG